MEQQPIIKIGITGGIGSGKSTIIDILKILNIPVYIADEESKRITNTSVSIRNQLLSLFKEPLLYRDDVLDKKLLASYIFSNRNNLDKVNKIIHPEVFSDFKRWIKQQNNSPIIGVESAILFESGMHELIDYSITIIAPLEDRINRTICRDNLSKQQVIDRINNQLSDDIRIKRSNFIIHNDEKESLIQQCLNLLTKIG